MNLKHKKIFWAVTIIIIALSPIFYLLKIYVIDYPIHYKKIVIEYSRQFNIDCSLIFSVIKTESNFDKNAFSKAGACGLMQIMPDTAKFIANELDETFDKEKLFEPKINIRYGTFYLKYLSKKFLNYKEILSAYNAGEGAVLDWLSNKEYSNDSINLIYIPFTETRNYVEKNLGNIQGYDRYYNLK